MGNDGGSIPDRRDLVRSKPKAEQADKANQTRARFFFCALSKKPLQEPIVSCALGKLYNKDALLEFLLDRGAYGDGQDICGHIRSLSDVKTLKLTPNPIRSSVAASASDLDPNTSRAQYVCPLTGKELNGALPFCYIANCGCVFSQAGLRAVLPSTPSSSSPPPSEDRPSGDTTKEGAKEGEKGEVPILIAAALDLCPQCGAKFSRSSDIRSINPGPEEEECMHAIMLERRALEKATKTSNKKKRKAAAVAAADDADSGSKKARADDGEGKPQSSKVAPTTNPTISAASRALTSSLAAEAAKRQAEMSDAVKSLYGDKSKPARKETFMTRGTFTRYA